MQRRKPIGFFEGVLDFGFAVFCFCLESVENEGFISMIELQNLSMS